MKILVTGANGYLGTGIVKSLLDKGQEVIAVDFSIDKVDCRAERIEGSVFDMEDPYVQCGKPECVLHLAWRDGFQHFSDAHIEDLPIHVAFLKKMAGNINQLAVMGSMHEVGFFEGSIDEHVPCHPQSFYGIAKNALRDTASVLAAQNQIIFQWLRGFYIVGNSPVGSSIFAKIAYAAQNGKREFPFTMGQNQFDFLDYEEFCEQAANTVRQTEVDGIINICSGRPEKLADRVERYIRENKFDIELKYGAFPDRPYDSKAVWGNSSKIERIMESVK